MSVWWLSFCDPERAPGSQFLGVAIVDADGDEMVHAVTAACVRGCNPGGEIMGHPVPTKYEHHVPHDMRNRLLTREEAERIGAQIAQLVNKERARHLLGKLPRR